MRTTATLLFGLALACALAASMTGCSTRTGGLSPVTINAGLASTNRVGVAIANGQMVSSIMDKDSVLGVYADVAKAAIEGGQEVALIGLSHGADKKPNVESKSTTEQTLQDVLAQGIKAAKSGGSEAALAEAGIGIVKGLAKLSQGDDSTPQADNSSANVFALFAGTGANAAGVGAMAEGRLTRVEAIKASRASNVSTVTDTYKETVSADGLQTITALAKLQAEIEKAKISTGGAASPVVVKPPVTGAGTNVGGVTPPPVASGSPDSDAVAPSTPKARMEAMYPGMRFGGGNDGAASERSLWKPDSDNSGDLVVVLPHSAMGKILSMTVGGETVAPDSIGNGWRPHLRFSKPGSAYSGPFTIKTSEGDWTGTAPGGKRTEPIPMSKASGPLKVSDLQPPPVVAPPAPTNSGEVATAQGEPLAP